jgi:hypothetical protein
MLARFPANNACGAMPDQIQRQFAADTGHPGCRAAVIGRGGQATNLTSYYESPAAERHRQGANR